MAPQRRIPVLFVAGIGLSLLAGCEGGGPPVALGICQSLDPDAEFDVRDSAGIRIVENLRAAEGDGPELAADPAVVIGGREGDPDDVIGRLAGAVLLADGRFVVADGLAMELRVHAPDGALLRRFGGPGDGPEEFSRSLALHRGPGDTLVVAHEFGLRYRRVLADGTFLDGGYVTAAPGEAPVYHSLLGVFGDGGLLVVERGLGGQPSEPATQVTRLEVEVSHLDPRTGALSGELTLPRQDGFTYLHGPGEYEGFLTFGDLPFGRVESWALGRSEIFLGRGDVFEVERRAPSGELTGRFRICEEPRPVDPDELERTIDGLAARYEEPQATREGIAMRGVALPTVEPAHLEMRMDGAGRLWVRDFAPDWEDRTWPPPAGGSARPRYPRAWRFWTSARTGCWPPPRTSWG